MALTREEVSALMAKGATEDEIFAADDDGAPPATAPATAKRHSFGVRNLPDIAAAPFGFMPGPVGAALSGIAGMGGKAVQMGMTGERPEPMLPIGGQIAGHPLAAILPPQVMREGAKHAGLGLAGAGAAKVVGGVGRAAYQGALRPTVGMLRRFPEMVDDMMRQRVPLGAAGEPVAEKALGKAVARQGVLLDKAEMAGATVPTGDAIARARQIIADVQRSGVKVPERVRTLTRELNTFIRDNAADLTPNQANKLVQTLGDDIEAVFSAKATGTFIAGGRRLATKMQATLQREMNKALRKSVPGIKKAKRETQAAMAAKEGVAHSVTQIKKGVPARIPLIPTMARAAIPDELRGIELWSRMGLGMNHPAMQAFLRQAPRGAAAAFSSGTMPPDTLRNDER